LTEMARRLAGAAGVVGVDSGLAHLAAALSIPAVTLYGPTRTELTGARGRLQTNLQAQFECAPCMRKECSYRGTAEVVPACFGQLQPTSVWSTLATCMDEVTG
ncbi:MAG: lipopolysaccharide heptosyltransferase 1, partial [Gammaproteobacteria bacterium]|nr:lipopolysaccharide heptosyltransferase 1 [Gammaproteobacteria bacterium]